MSNHIDFYFDIISPYAYIAHKKILKHKNIIFNYKPVYLGGLHKLAGIDSPAFNKYKLRNNINDCNLVSEKNNIEFKWNSNFPINSLNIMRGYISVSKDKQNDYLNCFFDAYWKNNHDLSKIENMSKLISELNYNTSPLIRSSTSILPILEIKSLKVIPLALVFGGARYSAIGSIDKNLFLS